MPWRMRYYLSNVLAMFYNQSEKYSIQTDEFEGTVRIRDSYLRSKGNTRDETYLNVEFGFRACRHGEWAIAAYGPDLDKASVEAFTYDGDTPQDARKAIRQRANIVLTNPDMLHAGIL